MIKVIPNRLHKMQTTRSWDYLQLSPRLQNSLLQKSRMGNGAIIGLLDTGSDFCPSSTSIFVLVLSEPEVPS